MSGDDGKEPRGHSRGDEVSSTNGRGGLSLEKNRTRTSKLTNCQTNRKTKVTGGLAGKDASARQSS